MKKTVSTQTRNNWLIDAALLISALLASISGIYFLFFPSGGYQGGRNPSANMILLFSRATWDLLHTWSSVIMISVVAIHFVIHWKWIVSMSQRVLKEITNRCGCLNRRGKFNVAIDALVAGSFLLTALSGIYFLFFPGHGFESTTTLLFSRTTWDLIHTWSAVTMIAAAAVHFAIHWQWAIKVTRRVFGIAAQPGIQTIQL